MRTGRVIGPITIGALFLKRRYAYHDNRQRTQDVTDPKEEESLHSDESRFIDEQAREIK
jgi:hypothetical protein